ncbi:MAG: redoxin domain-containing protein, partial [Balneolaceae bacterium]|nr:redoxin domain-containing protein [Balneolaceae bacterium]
MKPSITVLLILLVTAPNLHAQQPAEAEVDSAFEKQIDRAWEEIREAVYTDSLETHYASVFFDYYLEHPESKTGRRAVRHAFMMWGNTGNAQAVEEAIAKIDRDSEIWAEILNNGLNAYSRSDSKDREDVLALLDELKQELTHPRARSAVLQWLARSYQMRGTHTEQAIAYHRKIIELAADSFMVRRARSNLREMEELAVGNTALDFSHKTLSGDTFTLSEHRGKVVLLEFWATWCGPCYPEFPHLRKIHKSYADEEFKLVGVALDQDLEKLERFVKDSSLTWTQIPQTDEW